VIGIGMSTAKVAFVIEFPHIYLRRWMEYLHAGDVQQLWFSIYAETTAAADRGEIQTKKCSVFNSEEKNTV
jgi:hypothetical protein